MDAVAQKEETQQIADQQKVDFDNLTTQELLEKKHDAQILLNEIPQEQQRNRDRRVELSVLYGETAAALEIGLATKENLDAVQKQVKQNEADYEQLMVRQSGLRKLIDRLSKEYDLKNQAEAQKRREIFNEFYKPKVPELVKEFERFYSRVVAYWAYNEQGEGFAADSIMPHYFVRRCDQQNMRQEAQQFYLELIDDLAKKLEDRALMKTGATSKDGKRKVYKATLKKKEN